MEQEYDEHVRVLIRKFPEAEPEYVRKLYEEQVRYLREHGRLKGMIDVLAYNNVRNVLKTKYRKKYREKHRRKLEKLLDKLPEEE
jgi:hypothetical protein